MGLEFTRAWEDDRLDAELLAIGPGERALVIAGAGDTALALAAGGGEIVAVDRNPDQLRLAALKLAAVGALPADRLHAWFEAGRDQEAAELYRSDVRGRLAPADASWWDERIVMLARGLHEATGVGRPFGLLGRFARFIVPELEARIETVREPGEQVAWWRARVAPRLFSRPMHWLLGWSPVLRPLAPNRHERARMRAGGWSHGLVARIDGVVARALVREHPWWRPLTSGRPADAGHGAAWLDPARIEAVAAGAGRIHLVLEDVGQALAAQPEASLRAVSLSNVPDWLEPGAEAALARAVRQAAAPGARILLRRVVRGDGPDPFAAAGLVRDPVSASLPARDRTALYEVVDLYRAP